MVFWECHLMVYRLSARDGTHPPHLMTEGLVEVSGFAFVLALSWI